jgi:DNA-directed RNA polymerase alpha subunit
MNEEAKISSLLPSRTARTLARAGIDSIEEIKARYPEKLLRIAGLGMRSLRAIETAFFPGQKYEPTSRKNRKFRGIPKSSEDPSQDLHTTKTIDTEGLR